MIGLLRAVGLLAIVVCGSAVAQPMERHSFLNRHVSSTSELVRQVRRDEEVRLRFQRHFAMSEAELVTYFNQLELQPLRQTGLFTIYGVPDNGRIHSRIGRIRKGELVFVNAQGQPILYARCGNPLTRGPAMVTTPNDLVARLVEEPQEEVREVVVPNVEAESVEEEIVAEIAEPTIPELVEEAVVTTTESAIPVAGSAFSPWFLPLLGLPFLGGGGGGGDVNNPIPEPTTMLILGAGAAALIRRRKAGR